jgi:ubiquinone/menaquinone biosynthesis C-methylase UbiE
LKDTRKAYEEIAETYNQKNYSNSEIVDDLTKFLGEIKGNLILDIGSGHGRDSKYFSDKELTVIGIDLSVKLTRIAREKASSANFLLADMRRLPFRKGVANGLWICASFHHLPSKYAPSTLSGFKYSLCPGGVIHLSVKKGDFRGYEKQNRYQGKPRFYTYYENEQLTKYLVDTGFRIISESEDVQEEFKRKWINIIAVKP